MTFQFGTEGEPRNPNRLVSMSYFLTTIGAGALLANNWKRLGKPEWARLTLILSIVAGVSAILIIIGTILIVTADRYASERVGLLFPGIGLGFGINFGFMYSVLILQNPAYKRWQKEGFAALSTHTYNVRRSILFFVVFVILCSVGFTLLFAFVSRKSY